MRAKSTWTLQSFLTCLVWNGVLTGFFFLLARQILLGFHQWLDPILAAGDTTLPEDVRSGLLNLQQLCRQAEQYLIPVVFGAGGLITLVLWLFLLLQGRGLARRTLKEAQPLPGQAVISQAKPKKAEPAQTGVEAAPVAPPMPSPLPRSRPFRSSPSCSGRAGSSTSSRKTSACTTMPRSELPSAVSIRAARALFWST